MSCGSVEVASTSDGVGDSNVIANSMDSVDHVCCSCVKELCPPPPIMASAPNAHLRIENFKDDKAIHHYTGLESYAKFSFVLQTLGPAAKHLNYKCGQYESISTENKFFLMLAKLRLHLSNYQLSLLAQLSEAAVSDLFSTWVCFCYFQWKELNIFPDSDINEFHMPYDFHEKYPQTRVIIDGLEIPITKPKMPVAQQATFSTYKNGNTLKCIVGCTAGGLISHIPDSFGGSASDRSLVMINDMTDKLDAHDAIMADKGFSVQDLYESRDIAVNIPTFVKKTNRLSNKAVIHDRKVASKRVHVERVIGLAKTYKILATKLTPNEIALGSQIMFVCFMLCNFRRRIVPDNA